MTAVSACRARGRPCDECPWRLDVPRGAYPVIAGALHGQAPVAQGHAPLGAPLVACHKSPAGHDVICAGWLAVEGHNHLGVRLLVIAGQILAVALRPGPGLAGAPREPRGDGARVIPLPTLTRGARRPGGRRPSDERRADAPFVYAGIGSRKTPAEILALMAAIARALAERGWTLRSGGATGADQAFFAAATAAGGDTEMFLPWAGFQQTALGKLGAPTRRLTGAAPDAFALASTYHPVWPRLPDTVKALHARNCHQILGAWLDSPVHRVICWTPDGSLDGSSRAAGGTGQALRIAAARGIPVVNLALDEPRERLAALRRHARRTLTRVLAARVRARLPDPLKGRRP